MDMQGATIKIYNDSEMQDAIAELKQAEMMFDNAINRYRQDEAYHRIEAAKKRIEAIRFERGDLFVEKVVRETQKQKAIPAY